MARRQLSDPAGLRRLSFAVAIVLVLGVLLSAAAGAGAGEDRFSPQDIAKLETVVAAVVSPDGRQVAYALSVPRQPLEEDNGAAWVELGRMCEDFKKVPNQFNITFTLIFCVDSPFLQFKWKLAPTPTGPMTLFLFCLSIIIITIINCSQTYCHLL